jgi:hypothetical protein
MPKVVKPYCSRCGKHLSPAWKSKCEHCKAPFTAFPPEFRTEIVAPGDEIETPRSGDWGGDIGLDAIIYFATHIVADVRRGIRRRRADRHRIWLGAEVVDGGSGLIRIRVDNRRATPILVTAIGLTRYRDPAAAYRVPRSDAVTPGGSIEVMVDSASAVTAAPTKERIFNRDLDHVFIEIDHDPERITDLLPPEVRSMLQGRRQRYVRYGRP